MISGTNIQRIELTSGLTHEIDLDNDNDIAYILYGSPSLLSPIAITYTGTPKAGDIIDFYYIAAATGRDTITILGTLLPSWLFAKKLHIKAIYDGSDFVLIITPSLDDSAIILTNSIAAKQITPALISNIGDGKILVGDGIDVNAVELSGDATLSSTGIITIEDDAVTTIKVNDEAITTDKLAAESVTADKLDEFSNTQVIIIPVSLETDFIDEGFKVKIPYNCYVTNVYACVTSEIEGTDDGTITLYNDDLVSMTALTITGGEGIGYGVDANITTNNIVEAGDKITVKAEKTTPGGTVLLSITLLKTTTFPVA